jgi:putative endonuclease
LGRLGEGIAARFLIDHGLDVVARNVRVGKAELDLIAFDSGTRVVAEVRTITADADPIDAAGHAKRRRVNALGRQVGAGRVDFIGVRVGPSDVRIHWVPGCG